MHPYRFRAADVGLRIRIARRLIAPVAALAALALPAAAMAAATINLGFTPPTINPGDPAQVVVSIFNSSPNALTSAAITVPLTAGVTIASTPSPSDTCGFAVASAPAGGSTIELSAGTVPAAVAGGSDGSCTFTVSVNSTAPGNHGTTVQADGPSNGFSPGGATAGFSAVDAASTVTNATAATATLAVNTLSVPSGAITFSPSAVYVGETTTLSITLTNANAFADVPLTTFSDTLPTGTIVAPTPAASVTCAGGTAGTLTATPGASSVTLAGGTIAAGTTSTCVLTVKIVAPATTGSLTDSVLSNAVGNTRGLVVAAFSNATPLTVASPASISESLSTGSSAVRAGQASTLTLTISNASSFNTLSVNGFTDNLTAGLVIAASPAPAVNCTGTGAIPGTLTATAGATSLTLTGATAGLSGHCTITLGVSMAAAGTGYSTPATTVANGTQLTNAAVSPANLAVTASPATLPLTANSQFTVAKTQSTSSPYVGQSLTYTVTISNWSAGSATSVAFSDSLQTGSLSGAQMVLAAGSALGAGCSGGTLSATLGASSITWTGGTVAAGSGASAGTCTITIGASIPTAASVGDIYVNSLAANTAVTGTDSGSNAIKNAIGVSVSATAAASLTVAQSSFAPSTIVQGGTATYAVTLTNPTTSALTNAAFTEPFATNIVVAPVPLASTTCSGTPAVSATSGAVSFAASGLTIPAGGNCKVQLSVTSTTVGTWTNAFAANLVTDTQGLSNTSASATKNLIVTAALSGTAAFSPTSAALGGSSRISVTLTNGGAASLSNVSVTAPMLTGTNAYVVATPPSASSTCAGSPLISAVAAATSISMSGATLAAGASCTLSFNVTTTAAGGASWSFAIPAGNATSAEGRSNNSAITAAALSKATVSLNVNKSFTPNSISGGTPSVLQIDITNPLSSGTTVNGVALTDSFPAGMQIYATPGTSTSCTSGTVSAVPGDTKVSLSGADIAMNTTCSVYVNVTSVKPLNLTNTIAIGAVTSQQGFTNTAATSASLSTLQGLGVEKSFAPTAIAPGQVSHLAITLISTLNTTALSSVALTDSLPSGIVVAPTPNVTSTCNTAPAPAAGAASRRPTARSGSTSRPRRPARIRTRFRPAA